MCDCYRIDPDKKIPKETLDAIEKAMQQPMEVLPIEETYPRFVMVPQSNFDKLVKELEDLRKAKATDRSAELSREVDTLKELNAQYQERATKAESKLERVKWHPMTESPEPFVDVVLRDKAGGLSTAFYTDKSWAPQRNNAVAWCYVLKEEE